MQHTQDDPYPRYKAKNHQVRLLDIWPRVSGIGSAFRSVIPGVASSAVSFYGYGSVVRIGCLAFSLVSRFHFLALRLVLVSVVLRLRWLPVFSLLLSRLVLGLAMRVVVSCLRLLIRVRRTATALLN